LMMRLSLAIIMNFFVLSACLAYELIDDEDLIDIDSGVTFESNNSIQGYGFVSTYQHINSRNPEDHKDLDIKNVVSGSGFYNYESLVRSKKDFDIDDDSKEVIGVYAEMNLIEDISASYEEESLRIGKSFKSGPIKQPWRLDTQAKNYEAGIAARYLFDRVTALDNKVRLDQITDADDENETHLDLDSRFTGIGHLSLVYTPPPIQGSTHPMMPELEMDEKYIGSFHLAKKIGARIEEDTESEEDIWLSCCEDGFLDIYEYNLMRMRDCIFNCSYLASQENFDQD